MDKEAPLERSLPIETEVGFAGSYSTHKDYPMASNTDAGYKSYVIRNDVYVIKRELSITIERKFIKI